MVRNADRVVCKSGLIVCRPDLVVGKFTPGRWGLPHGEVKLTSHVVLASTPTRRYPMPRFNTWVLLEIWDGDYQ